jgi:subtilisin family serine protease
MTLAVVLALALLTCGGGAAAASADVCIVVDPVVAICRDTPPQAEHEPPPEQPAASQAAGAPKDPEPVRRTSTELRYDPRRLAVTFDRGTSPATARRVIAEAGATLEEAIPAIDAYLVDVEPDRRAEALASFRSSSVVASASREPIAEAFDTSPDDSDWPQQDGLRVVGFPKAWDVTQGSSRVVVAVLDTGVDARHPDIPGALVPGYDFVNSDTDPADDHGHGTAVAGVIAARANNRVGGAGVCSRCSVMPVKVLDAEGSGLDTLIAAGIVWAADHGANVINLSLGGPGTNQELGNAVGYATGKGVIVVAAAGNAGTTMQFYPAADPRAISVAATTVADQRYSWSSFGPWVRVAAPGCNVAPVLGGGFGSFCGTSSAAPLVTGLVALELSAQPSATAQQVEQALVSAAVPLPDFVQYGRIDAARTLSLLRPAPVSATAVFRGTIGPRARTRTFPLTVGAGIVTATLRFSGAKRLALSFGAAQRVAGPSPLQLRATAAAGTIVLRVSGDVRTKTTFVLRVTYTK